MLKFLQTFMNEHEGDGTDLGGTFETQDNDAQKIIDRANGIEPDEGDSGLPSDNKDSGEPVKFANKYDSVDDLKKGIGELGSTLPEYVLNGLSDEALEQHYLELQKEFSSKGRKFEKKEQEEADSAEDDKADDEKPSTAISKELWADISTEFESTGGITSDMYDKLEAVGIPSEVVDNYIDGLNQKQEVFKNNVLEIAGGQEQYDTIKAWAEDGGISQAELAALQTMSYDAILGAYAGIKARYDLANGQIQKRIVGNTGAKSGSSYTSQEDYMADVADKRYGKNRVFTESVDRKFQNSKL